MRKDWMDGVADTPEKRDKYIRTIYNKANEMDTLLNELTLYAKIDTNLSLTISQRSMYRNILMIA
mgnify:CR=1 FL=1